MLNLQNSKKLQLIQVFSDWRVFGLEASESWEPEPVTLMGVNI
ncbi:hypothetical protein SAMN05660236_5430 [Ohtaekwangia koreensis]|uniref:Uncharacterized protein n=1 Tax=Ohtaekwangia koreensis TaxID=688867 RepID=A0A1T5MHW0_9BACT|nr:hypothetical protein SAMN05660236_5430 [Ohtaekwangia koreensis]